MAHLHSGRTRFTLTELLFVVAIISVLVAFLMPALSKSKILARQSYCLATQRQLGLANCMYSNESRWSLPLTTMYGTPEYSNWTKNLLFQNLAGYDGKYGIFWPKSYICPDSPYTISAIYTNSAGFVRIDPSYGLNSQGLKVNATPIRGYRMSQIRQPSKKMFLADSASFHMFMTYVDAYYVYGEGQYPADAQVAYRHNRGANLAYFDGHAAWRQYEIIRVDTALWTVF